ncbi:hypothetical protein [Bacillus sp. P14.5]|nr:hypothetical protein [Bacillus sp. P14.5]
MDKTRDIKRRKKEIMYCAAEPKDINSRRNENDAPRSGSRNPFLF